MAANSNSIEIKLKFLTERLDAIQGSVKELEGLKRSALSTKSALEGLATIGALKIALNQVTSTFSELKKAIDLGGELSDLSASTGQTVSDLVVLQQAFRNAGIDAGATGQMLNLLQKSLTGVNENGEPTSSSFERLGLSLESLKAQSAIQQLESLSAAFTQIQNPADRTRIAMGLFGRSGGQMLAILSDSTAMGVARQQVGSLGDTMEKNAAAFDRLGDSWDAIGLRMTQLFAGIAEEVAPMLQRIADEANSLDLTQVGKEIGDLVIGLTDLLKAAAPLAIVLGSQFILETTLAKISAFAAGVAASTTALAAESAALMANTAAQRANGVARGLPGSSRQFGGGSEVIGGQLKVAGAPFSEKAYDYNREMGMAPADALQSARHAMFVASQDGAKFLAESAKAQSGLAGLAAKLAPVSSGLMAMGNSLANMIGPLGAVAAGIALGDLIQKKFFNWATSLVAGGWSTESDRQAAEDRAGNADLSKFMEKARGVRTDDDLEKLKKETEATLAGKKSERAGLWSNQTMEKGVLDGDIAALERFQKSLAKLNPEQAAAVADAAAAKVRDAKKQADDQTTMDASAKVLRDGRWNREKALKEEAVKNAAGEGDVGAVQKAISQKEFDIKVLRTKRQNGYDIDPKDINSAEDELIALKKLKADTEDKNQKKDLAQRGKFTQALIEKANQRKAMEDDLAMKEAADPKKLAQLKWQKDYEKMLEEGREAGMGDDRFNFAIRQANANMDEPDQQQGPGANVQAGYLTQLMATAMGNAATPPDDPTKQVVTNTATLITRIETLTKAVKEKQGDVFT